MLECQVGEWIISDFGKGGSEIVNNKPRQKKGGDKIKKENQQHTPSGGRGFIDIVA